MTALTCRSASVLVQVKNLGPDLVPNAEIVIDWPFEAESGKHLLYLMDVDVRPVSGPVLLKVVAPLLHSTLAWSVRLFVIPLGDIAS